MSKRTAILRRQDQLFTEIAMMQSELMQQQHHQQHSVLVPEDPMVSSVGVPDDYSEQALMQRASRYLLSPHQQKMFQMPSPPQVAVQQQQQQQHPHHQQQQQHPHHQQHQQQVQQQQVQQQQPQRHRSRKNSQHMTGGLMDHQQQQQTYVSLKPSSMLMQDVFGQGPMGHLVMPTSPDMGVGQNMEVGSVDVGNGEAPHGDVILVPNMLKSEVIESGEVVVGGGGVHSQSVGNEIVIEDHAGRLGLGMVGSSGEEGEFGDSALVIDTGAMRDEIQPSIGYDCGECGAVMKSRGSLKKHILKYHTQSTEPEEEVDRVYQCQACPYQTQRRDKLDKHMGKHLAEGLTTTGKKRSKGTLPQRMRHAAEEYKCALCPYKCTVEKALRKHNKLHQVGTKQFVVKVSCYVCGKDRSTEADLRKHMKKHRDGKDFQCDICGFASVQLKKIIQHRRMHTGEKPHLCPHCTYRSSRRDNLRSHVRRMHKKENMYIDTFNPRAEQAAAEINTF